MKYFLLGFIALYQRTLSPDHGLIKPLYPHGYCRFYPSCSEFAYQSIERRGFVKGTVLSVVRILHCNPFTTPRVHPVPKF